MPGQSSLDFIKIVLSLMFGKWSVVLKISDSEVYYSLVQGEHPEADQSTPVAISLEESGSIRL
jgi:hypothetical protein